MLHKIWNYCVLNLRNCKYDGFPDIRGILVVSGKGNLSLGNSLKINSNMFSNPVGLGFRTMFYIAPNANILIGSNVGITNSLLYSNKSIIINDNVLIGGGCQILDSDFHALDYNKRLKGKAEDINSKQIVIGEGVFLGTSCIILKGVTIGDRSIVAAGSIVSKSIPPGEIWGGNPARFIKKIENPPYQQLPNDI